MDNQELILEEYKAYVESKDRFVNRSFMINRFYLLIVFALMIYLFIQLDNLRLFIPMTLIVTCALGMAASALWWLNQDSYAYLIKVKLSSVIEKIEGNFPVAPHIMEYEAIKERNGKKRVLFVDIQKGLAFFSFVVFFSIFTYSCGLKIVEIIK